MLSVYQWVHSSLSRHSVCPTLCNDPGTHGIVWTQSSPLSGVINQICVNKGFDQLTSVCIKAVIVATADIDSDRLATGKAMLLSFQSTETPA